jgi:hypothetical protein
MMDRPAKNPAREEALRELKRQMAEQRARIDPHILKIARQAAERAQDERERQTGAAPSQQQADGKRHAGHNMVPYDRAAAAEAIALFLRNCEDREAFEKRLLLLLRSRQN